MNLSWYCSISPKEMTARMRKKKSQQQRTKKKKKKPRFIITIIFVKFVDRDNKLNITRNTFENHSTWKLDTLYIVSQYSSTCLSWKFSLWPSIKLVEFTQILRESHVLSSYYNGILQSVVYLLAWMLFSGKIDFLGSLSLKTKFPPTSFFFFFCNTLRIPCLSQC